MPTTYKIDSSHARVGFAVKHMMVSTVRGHFNQLNGQISVEGDDPRTAAAEVTIKAGSIDTGEPNRDADLRSEGFLATETYPEISFRSTAIEPRGGTRYGVTGDLTIRDVTRPVALDVEVEGPITDPWGNQRVGVSIGGKINRKDWGIQVNAVLETGGLVIAEEVRLEIEAEFVRVQETAAAT